MFREGVRRQALYRDGKFHDIYLMGILREEWEAQGWRRGISR